MWVVWMIFGIVICILLVLTIVVLRYVRDYWTFLDIPHDDPKPILQVFQEMSGSRFHTTEAEQAHYADMYQRFKGTGPFCGFYALLQPRVLVLEQDLINQILSKDFSNFNDRGIYHNFRLDPISGDLFSRSGSDWKEMRLKLDPIFSQDRLEYLAETVYEESSRLLESFERIIRTHPGCSINVHHLVRRYVLNTIAINVFGLDATLQQKYPLDQFEIMAQMLLTTRRHGNYLTTLLSRYQQTGRRLGFRITGRKVNTYFMALIDDVLNERERDRIIRRDYLQLLIDLKTQEYSTHEIEIDGDAKKLQTHLYEELVAHLVIFLKSGYHPTARTISFLLYELARNQDIQDRVRLEVQQVMNDNNGQLDYACLQNLHYLGLVISETIRLHPVVPFLVRRTLSDYIVPSNTKYFIKKDTFVIIPIHAIHNDESLFAEPHLFQPDRFGNGVSRIRDKSLWLGFGGGPRACIGIHFAQTLIRFAIARLVMRFRFSLDSNQVVIKSFDTAILRVEMLSAEQPNAHTNDNEPDEFDDDDDDDEFDDDDSDHVYEGDDNGLVKSTENRELTSKEMV